MTLRSYIIWLTGRLLGKRFRLWYHVRTGRWLWGIFCMFREVPPLQNPFTREEAELDRKVDGLLRDLYR